MVVPTVDATTALRSSARCWASLSAAVPSTVVIDQVSPARNLARETPGFIGLGPNKGSYSSIRSRRAYVAPHVALLGPRTSRSAHCWGRATPVARHTIHKDRATGVARPQQ